jgi:type I restriction enzyme R subunit
MVDEAHRTQGSDMGDNLFEAFPNAARVAFTGTPLITERHGGRQTVKRFGEYIDTYKLMDSVEDGATLQILYEGRTANTALRDKAEFDTAFEDLFADRSAEDLLAIKKKYGATGDILEAENRIGAIGRDLVGHYIDNILPNGFKAQVVCHSKLAALRYQGAFAGTP